MPTNTPPPYFPQGSLMPPDPNRWRKTKGAIFGCLALLLLLVIAVVSYFVFRARG
ncbi:MAG: hypothetical protein LC746_03060 [Acidobacteria bacterium]|nr:hypothetical protein [Acidobacteriota bacterium]